MKYDFSWSAFVVFAVFVGSVLALSFYLGRKAKSASGYYAAHGQINWFVNGVAFAGDYLSAASFLGICGMIAFFGYDGFLYSIGFLAGWVVALFVIAEPLKRLGKFTFADALDAKFNSRGIKLAAAVSTLLVSLFYLIPQMVGAGTLVKPLLGLPPVVAGVPSFWIGVGVVGVVVILIVTTAGMVSTTWVQFIKGSLLVIFCLGLTGMILWRGLKVDGRGTESAWSAVAASPQDFASSAGFVELTPDGPWAKLPYRRFRNSTTGEVKVYRPRSVSGQMGVLSQMRTEAKSGQILVNGLPQTHDNDLKPVGKVEELPNNAEATGPIGPVQFIYTLGRAKLVVWRTDTVKEPDGSITSVFYPELKEGADLMQPGGSSTFKGVRSPKFTDRLDFISLMIALFCGTASLPHILIRYYTVKDGNAARKSTVVGIASIGFFYVLTLFLGLGAMTSGGMDPSDTNMAAPLLARSFGNLPFAVISAIAFTTVLGTVSGLIMAASGAVAHDLMTNFLKIEMTDHGKVRAGKVTAVCVGIVAMVLGVLFKDMNVGFLVGWAFNVAASANLPALVMLLFWKRTTKQGITAAVVVGLMSSLAWLLLSGPAYQYVYKLDPQKALAPFSQPGIVTIPLGFVVLVVVSLMTRRQTTVVD